jgi:adenylylsulfate reductase subunit B
MWMPAKINYAKCNGCGICYENCPLDVFAYDKELGVYKAAFKNDCWYCGGCVTDCPQKAVELTLPLGCL